MNNTILLGTLLATIVVANAQVYSTNWNSGFANAGVVPDNSFSGWSDSRSVSTMPAGTLQGVAVDIQLSSGWTSDLHAYLVSGSGFAVLLDRVGTPGLTIGYGAGTMTVTLADNGFNSQAITLILHGAGANASGMFNPDDNNAGFATTGASGSLGSFLGTSQNGTWSLFVADLSGGGVTTIQSWGLQMEIVPEPQTGTLALAGALVAFWLNRQIWSGVKKA